MLDWFNSAPESDVRIALRGCCAADAWVGRVAAGRPYSSEEALGAASDAATAELDDAGYAQALAAHPRIGERPHDHVTAWSGEEQSAMASADRALHEQMAEANAAYEQRFGHVYLVCATGRSAEELLAVCRARIGNDPVTERGVVLNELTKINRLRLGKLLREHG
jgi:2-oxo-4-hydroxy-4-carboxy-5-ureidoimidazoline decarboxylase